MATARRPDLTFRAEAPADYPAVAELLTAAFGGTDEARLVERLRRAPGPLVSRVAVARQTVVAHVLLSPLSVAVDGRPVAALALAPVAVRPEKQRQGIGSRLIEDALREARGVADAVIVLGHPTYYPRFGFSAGLAAKLSAPFSGSVFMALELRPGALAGQSGHVTYPAAFGIG